jgi:hypothetical protein
MGLAYHVGMGQKQTQRAGWVGFVLTVVVGLLVQSVAAIAPLDQSLMPQVQSAKDLTTEIDSPALHPLLSDVANWKPDDFSNARLPDYATLMANPSQYRGEPFIIEGLFAGAANRSQLAAPKVGLPGPWDGKAELWTIVVDEAKDEVVIVLLVDPPQTLPKGGSLVRLPARLYKVWSYNDLNNKPRAALMFVGKGVQVVERVSITSGKPNMHVIGLSVAAFIGFAVLIYLLRVIKGRVVKPTESADFRDRLKRTANIDEDELDQAEDEALPPLPKDPIEALKELERRSGRKD